MDTNIMQQISELTQEEMDAFSGGGSDEMWAYCSYLMEKYKSPRPIIVAAQSTKEERQYYRALENYKPGKPLPSCPDPNFNLDEWLQKTKR